MEAPKKKRSTGEAIMKFLIYGGWMLVIVVVLGIVIAVTTC